MGDTLFIFQNMLSFGHSFWDTLIYIFQIITSVEIITPSLCMIWARKCFLHQLSNYAYVESVEKNCESVNMHSVEVKCSFYMFFI